MTVRELPTIEKELWDMSVLHPLQSYTWGVIRQATGVTVVRFGVYEGDILQEVYEMTLHKVPLIPYTIGYIPRSQVPSTVFLEYLTSYCKKYKIIFVKFEPEARKNQVTIPETLRLSTTPLFYEWTRIIDLTKSIEQLKKELEATTRYNIGLAERKGIIVGEESTPEGFEAFYALYEDTTRRQNFSGHTKKYHQTIWEHFSKEGVAHILVARVGGVALSACELFLYKGVLYYTYAGSSMEQRNLKSMNALLWAVILFGKKHNAVCLDLWGVLPPDVTDATNPWAGFSDFKKGYGGEVVQMIGSYDFIAFSFLYHIYVIAFKIRKFLSR